MVLLESTQLGHSPFIISYCNDLRKFIEPAVIDKIEPMFHYLMDTSAEFTRKNCKFPQPCTPLFLVNHITRLIDTFINRYRPKNKEDENDEEVPQNINERLNNALVFATIWGIGGAIDETTRERFDQFLQELIQGENVIEKYKLDMEADQKHDPIKLPVKIGDCKSLFDMSYDPEENRWVNWLVTVPKYIVNRDDTFLQLSIPTID